MTTNLEMTAYLPPSANTWRLHSLPHLDFGLRTVSNQPQLNTQDASGQSPAVPLYVQSLIMLAVLSMGLVLLYAVADLVGRIIQCCQRGSGETEASRTARGLGVSLLVLSIVFLGVGFSHSHDAEEGFDSVDTSIVDMYGFYESLMAAGHELEELSSSTAALVQTTVNDAAAGGHPLDANTLQQAATIRDDLLQTQQRAATFVQDAGSFDFGSVRKPLSEASGQFTTFANLMFSLWLVATGIMAVIVWWNPASKFAWAVGLVDLACLVLIILSWFCGSVVLATVVGAADVCVDPTNVVYSAINNAVQGSASSSSSPLLLTSDSLSTLNATMHYYLGCEGMSEDHNPVVTPLRLAATELVKTGTQIDELKLFAVYTGDPTLIGDCEQLSTNVGDLQSFVSDLRASLLCPRLHSDIVQLQRGICGSLLSECTGLLMFLFASSLVFVVLRLLLSCPVRCCRQPVNSGAQYPVNEPRSEPLLINNSDANDSSGTSSLEYARRSLPIDQ